MIDQFPMYKLRVWGDIYAFPLIFVSLSPHYCTSITIWGIFAYQNCVSKRSGLQCTHRPKNLELMCSTMSTKIICPVILRVGDKLSTPPPPTSRSCNSLSKFPSEHPGEKNVTSYLDVPGVFNNGQNVYVGRVCLVYGNLSITHWRIAICLGTVKFPVTSHSCYFSHTYK